MFIPSAKTGATVFWGYFQSCTTSIKSRSQHVSIANTICCTVTWSVYRQQSLRHDKFTPWYIFEVLNTARSHYYAFQSLARFNSSPLILLLPSHMPPCFLVQVPCICNVNNDLAFQTYRWHFHCQLHSFLCVHECSCYLWYCR